MKKWILFLILFLVGQINYDTMSVLAETDKDSLAIKKVIENYCKGFAKRNLDLVMKQISAKYSSFDKEGNVVDYANLKSTLERRFKNLVNISISDLKITNLNVQDNKATLEMEYNIKGLNLDTDKDVNLKVKKSVSLVKEDSSWKIVQFIFKRTTDQEPSLESQPTKAKP